MFRGYRFEHPRNETVVEVGGWSYVWAGLFGLLSPWIIFMSGSYMSHPTTMMWVAVFLYALVMTRAGTQTMDDERWTMDRGDRLSTICRGAQHRERLRLTTS